MNYVVFYSAQHDRFCVGEQTQKNTMHIKLLFVCISEQGAIIVRNALSNSEPFCKGMFADRCGVCAKCKYVQYAEPYPQKIVTPSEETNKPNDAPVSNETMHPIQPIVTVDGVSRFKRNAIVEYLLDNGNTDLNKLATIAFTNEDRMQFAQLIGYSVSGFGELSYVSDEIYGAACTMEEQTIHEKDARIYALQSMLDAVRKGLKDVVPVVFSIHPDDLVT